MVNLFRKVFKDRNLTPWEKEVQKAKDANFRERNGSLAPSFTPRNGVYEYSRNFDYQGKNRKGSSYHAVLRLSFSPAPDYGWMITGVGTERMCVRGVEGGKQRKIIIDDGRITGNGKFYWKELREKNVEILVSGSLEPRYHLSNGFFTIDDKATFSGQHKVSSTVELGQLIPHSLKEFRRQGDLEKVTTPPPSPSCKSPGSYSHHGSHASRSKDKFHNDTEELKKVLMAIVDESNSLTEENTEVQDMQAEYFF